MAAMSATALIERPSTPVVRRTFAPAGEIAAATARRSVVGPRMRRIYGVAGEAAPLGADRFLTTGRSSAAGRRHRRIYGAAGEAASICAVRTHRFDIELPSSAETTAERRIFGAAGDAPAIRSELSPPRSDCKSAIGVDEQFCHDPAPRQGRPLLPALGVPAAEAINRNAAPAAHPPSPSLVADLDGVMADLAAADAATYENDAAAAGTPPAASRRRIARFASLQASSARVADRRCRPNNRR